MKKEVVQSMLHFILMDIKQYWIKELNTEGTDFNYDSQDVFRTGYEKCITEWKIIEEYPPEVLSDERIEILNDLREVAIEIIELYEKHKNFFRQYKREELMLNTYKTRHPHYNALSNLELKIILGIELEIPSRDQYYKSTFYDQYGFLLNDYHFEIYVFSKYLFNEIKDNFKETEKYKTFIENSDLAPYFPMGLVYSVYKLSDGILFESLSELEFYKSINLLELYSPLKIEKSAIKRAYYVLHKFSNCIKNKELKNYWINVILHRLGKDESNYSSRYRDVVSDNATDDDTLFANNVDEIFKRHTI
jgi:hypothetical protein